jgi:hypothetical protein
MKAMDESKDIGPALSKVKKELPFTVPEGYFSSLQSRLENVIHEKKQIAGAGNYRLQLWPSMAAAMLLMVALAAGLMVFRINHRNHAKEKFNAEISLVVEQELYSISDETILDVMESGKSDSRIQQTNNPEEMINYLLNEEVSEKDLLNAL